MDVWDEGSGESGRQQWTRNRDFKRVATFLKREDIWWDLQEGCLTGDREGNSRIFHQDLRNEGLDVVEESAPSETGKETAHRIEAGNVGALVTLGSFAPTDRKSRMKVINLRGLAPYQGAA
jgi:hypothetical protein